MDKIEEKIDSFLLLPEGWDYGQGVPTKPEIAEKAKVVYKGLGGTEENAWTGPRTDGGISLTIKRESYYVDVAIDGTGHCSVSFDI